MDVCGRVRGRVRGRQNGRRKGMYTHVWTVVDRCGLPWTVVPGRSFGRWWTPVDIGGHKN